MKPSIIIAVICLAACNSKWEKLPDDVLADKASECASDSNPSTATLQVCKNYMRECERRREKNIYVC